MRRRGPIGKLHVWRMNSGTEQAVILERKNESILSEEGGARA
jgi:hypothetical protein